MPNAFVRSYDFDPSLNIPTAAAVDFSWDEMLAAIVTVGKSRADDLRLSQNVIGHHREIVWRESLLRMAINDDRADFSRSQAYSRLDPSEKVGVSYMLGMAAASALCTRFLHVPFMMHLDVYTRNAHYPIDPILRYAITSRWWKKVCDLEDSTPDAKKAKELHRKAVSELSHIPPSTKDHAAKDKVLSDVFQGVYPSVGDDASREAIWNFLERLSGNSRPDLFALETRQGRPSRYVIVEAKGRSGGLDTEDRKDCKDSTALNKHKLLRNHGSAMWQALSKDQITLGPTPVSVGRHLAIFSHFDDAGLWQFSWKDPEEKSLTDQEIGRVPPGPLVADYYANLLALGVLEQAQRAENNMLVRLHECPDQFHVADTHFQIGFHPALHDQLRRAFKKGGEYRDMGMNVVPALLEKLEAGGEIGPGKEFSINGVSIRGNDAPPAAPSAR